MQGIRPLRGTELQEKEEKDKKDRGKLIRENIKKKGYSLKI